jgi:hypothetical protein
MSFVIKQFGNNTTCVDVNALNIAAKDKYANSSVCITQKQPSGIDKLIYADISSIGVMTDSYTEMPLDFK